jgi:hypothetical protein
MLFDWQDVAGRLKGILSLVVWTASYLVCRQPAF